MYRQQGALAQLQNCSKRRQKWRLETWRIQHLRYHQMLLGCSSRMSQQWKLDASSLLQADSAIWFALILPFSFNVSNFMPNFGAKLFVFFLKLTSCKDFSVMWLSNLASIKGSGSICCRVFILLELVAHVQRYRKVLMKARCRAKPSRAKFCK